MSVPTKKDLESEVQQFMEDYRAANRLFAVIGREAFPERTSIVFSETFTFDKQMSVRRLFPLLGLGEDNLQEVYEFKDGRFSGRFAQSGGKTGEQKLADLLGKEITFLNIPKEDYIQGVIDPSYLSIYTVAPSN